MIKSNKQLSNDRSSNNGSTTILKKRKKVNLVGNESFLDISALHDSFLSSVKLLNLINFLMISFFFSHIF